MKATVRNGRLTLDEPTALPEGTVLDLVVDESGDDLDDADRARLHAALEESEKDFREGRVYPAEEVLAELDDITARVVAARTNR